ncbi:cytochrome P450 6A1-like isoform X1 [Sitophilus oryzae]|uniref:Cytochrome P450 6A1-like isoform X1 n=1 Tax=Sitophilus oryzae TaxID=7048 RepID=A0A6J2YDE3_SITOR|nr:cytochrome P450 6A1-like isoform X1 [Sitophilus oryzae]
MLLVYIPLVSLVFVIYVKWRLNYWKRRGLFQLDPEFFFGNTRNEVLGSVSKFEVFRDRYLYIKSVNRKQCGMYAFLDPWYLPVDHQIIKNILQRDFSYFENHGMYHHEKDIVSMNLFNIEGEAWKQLRVKLTPSFSSLKIKTMFQILLDKTTILEKIIHSYSSENEPINIKDMMRRFTSDVIASCGFGVEANSMEDPDNEFTRVGMEAFYPGLLKFFLIETFPAGLLANLGLRSNGYKTSKFFSDLVTQTLQYREKNSISRSDFLQLLLELKRNKTMTDNEIIAQCFIFFIAGFETSSTTAMFAMLELAQNEGIQNKLRDEIRSVLGKHGGDLCCDAVMEMEYLDKIVNETLRKFPPGAVIPRRCTKTYKVPGTEVVIEKGTRVIIPVWGLHRDPEFYPNPEEFNPENFSTENKAKRPDIAYIPFGEGPRMCIGLRFGVLQTKLALIALLRNFKHTLNSRTKTPIEIDPEAIFVLNIKGDVWLNVSKV